MYPADDIARAKATLPKVIGAFVDSPEFHNTLAELGKGFSLNLYEIASLTDVVTTTVLGLEPRTSFPGNLSVALPHASAEKQEKLVHETNERIFKEVEKRLHKPPDTAGI